MQSPDHALLGVLDHLSDGICVLDAGWRFGYVNTRGARLLGRSPAELRGVSCWDVFPEAVGGPAHRAWQEARDTGRSVRVSERHASGRLFEATAHPSGDDLVVVFRDITRFQRTTEELREYAELMAAAEGIAGFGVWRWDLGSDHVRWSDELHRIYGVEPGQFDGTVDDFLARLHPEDRERVWEEVRHALETHGPFSFEERIVRPDGSVRVLLSQGRVVLGDDQTPAELFGVCHDITERRAAARALELSRRRLRAVIDHTPSVVAVKDLDGRYVMANDAAGALVGRRGDELVGLLCVELFPPQVADQLRANDRIAVAEGRPVFDETVLLLGGEPRTFETVTFPLPDEQGRPVEVCTLAQDATERRERESERRVREEWHARVHDALADGRMVVFAQPIRELASGETRASELLVRMRTRDGDLLPPSHFLPAAERFGVVAAIDTWVVRTALDLAPAQRLSVNLSAVTLSDQRARQEIVGLLGDAPDAARALVFEITETADLDHLEAAEAFAADVVALGCEIALDDCGTGFGSFTYVRALPLRYLKIDREFVGGMTRSAEDRRVAETVISLARGFGLQTIAEGIEDQATLDLVRELGADFGQGFFIGRPAPLHARLPT